MELHRLPRKRVYIERRIHGGERFGEFKWLEITKRRFD